MPNWILLGPLSRLLPKGRSNVPTPNDVKKAHEAARVNNAKDVTPEVDDNPTGEDYIMFDERVVVDGIDTLKRHGPMPISQWAAYEKENGL